MFCPVNCINRLNMVVINEYLSKSEFYDLYGVEDGA